MQFKKSTVEEVLASLRKYFDIDVEYSNSLFTVHADSPDGINEFEVRLVAAQMKEDGDIDGETGNIAILLDEVVNFVGTRDSLRPKVTLGGSWQARYLTTLEE